MELLGETGQVEARFSPFGDCVNLAQIGVQIGTNIPLARKSFWVQTMELLGDVGQLEAHFSLLGDCANLDTR
jgi:hypothetical protein